MFCCRQCDKTFQTRTSLTRHTHNHSDRSSRHVCSLCKVAFARRDILQRHIRASHAVGNPARKRCHTACESCRAARIKCDGETPCHECALQGRECRRGFGRGRVSQAVLRGATRTPPSNAEQDQGQSGSHGEDLPSNREPSSLETSVDGHASYDILDAISPDILYPMDTNLTAISMAESTMPYEGLDFSGTAWPWVHENLYLLDGPSFTPELDGAEMSLCLPRQSPECTQVHDNVSTIAPPAREDSASRQAGDSLGAIVEDLVAYAASASSAPLSPAANRCTMWKTAAHRLQSIKSARNSPGAVSHEPGRHLLDHFVHTHMTDFNPLWPLFSQDGFETDVLHPVTYLTLTSIGAMYGSVEDRKYGTLMHERLRRLLTAALFDLEGVHDDLVWLSQARLLTQVAALYFGQRQAFSYAQHLGAILVAQARRMDLFGQPRHSLSTACRASPPAVERSLWILAEQRRRIAFGILRADVFTSILLGTRPYLTYEEFKITLPRSDGLWHNEKRFTTEQLVVAQHFEDEQAQLGFADLVQIALETNEQLPELTAVGYELCLFGLQGVVWSFSQDTDVLRQMKENQCTHITGSGSTCGRLPCEQALASNYGPSPSFQVTTTYRESSVDRLAGPPRHMHSLESDYTRLLNIMQLWHRDMNRARSRSIRDTRMSSTLLYHISHLQLLAPLQDLHCISYASMEERPADHMVLSSVRRWLNSKRAPLALSHAWSIWTLIRDEHNRAVNRRSRFNFLAFGGLHHAAVTLWTFHVSRRGDLVQQSPNGDLDIQQWLSESCADMFDLLSPLGGASFGTAARKLASRTFPERSHTSRGQSPT